MSEYPQTAVERMMKVQEVRLGAIAQSITWWQAAEIIGISDRSLGRWRHRLGEARAEARSAPQAAAAALARGCCCIWTGAGIAGFRMSAGMT